MNKIDPSKKYTSGGKPVEFLHRAPDGWTGAFPWKGIAGGREQTWTDDGFHYIGIGSALDLIEVREPLEVMVAVNRHGKPECVTTSTLDGWDTAFPQNAPHTLRKFREVIE